MLCRLVINNVALIERAEIEFGRGLNVLSGETGSGKSVILDSINFVLGAKADKSMIRHGEKECSVQAVFLPRTDNPVFDVLRELEIDGDEELVISRRFSADGRSSIKVNGYSVNATMLRRITVNLVDVHGQSEHFYLLSENNQLALLDKAAGAPLARAKEELASLLAENREIRQKLSSLGGDEAARGRRLDILKFQLDEIENASLREGEEEQLLSKRLFFNNIEKIMRAVSEAAKQMGEDGGAVDSLNGAKRSLSDIASLNEEYSSLEDRLESLALEAEDVSETLQSLAENLVYDENAANETEERLDLLKSLKKKYGASVEKIFAYRDTVAEEYDLLSHCDEEFAKLSARQAKVLSAIYVVCRKMTALREQAGKDFCGRVEQELKTLNIKNAQFCAEFELYSEEDASRASTDGLDRMRFLFSANKGEPLKPLNKVISGGEMSRLMLAIKTKMSDVNAISTYLFDEIDAGISGNTAKTVAEKFADIARDKQILAVSHLAQISAMADNNFLICKREKGEKTQTEILPLDENGKKRELIRLLGGDENSGAANTLAEELLAGCKKYKQSLQGSNLQE